MSFFFSIVCIILPLIIGPRGQSPPAPAGAGGKIGVGRTKGELQVCRREYERPKSKTLNSIAKFSE